MGENRLMCDLCEENQRLKERIKELEEKHFSECGQIAQYSDENAKLKELLKVMYEDIKRYAGGMCRVCTECNADFECKCEDFCATNKRSKWKYKYEPEILALIGEESDAG